MKRAAKIAIAASSAVTVIAIIAVAGMIHAGAKNITVDGKPVSEDLKCNITDPAKYGEWYGLLASTNLYTFPEQIPAGAADTEYRFSLDNNPLDPSSLVYLKCTYDADTYQSEVDRLKNIKGIRTDKDHYAGTAYVAMLKEHETEYAILFNQDTIVYVCYAEGMFPKHPDQAYMRKETGKKDSILGKPEQAAGQPTERIDYFSIYDGMWASELKYWPKSWTF